VERSIRLSLRFKLLSRARETASSRVRIRGSPPSATPDGAAPREGEENPKERRTKKIQTKKVLMDIQFLPSRLNLPKKLLAFYR
jgi:hypothetical protein